MLGQVHRNRDRLGCRLDIRHPHPTRAKCPIELFERPSPPICIALPLQATDLHISCAPLELPTGTCTSCVQGGSEQLDICGCSALSFELQWYVSSTHSQHHRDRHEQCKYE
ncbi:hypothetical protein V8C34DRAFT_211418 [Trichoderma compactum]